MEKYKKYIFGKTKNKDKMDTSEILTKNGFIQHFPYVSFFTKEISEVSCIKIDSCYFLKRNELADDETIGSVYFKVTKINLPISESKIFKKLDNVLLYINEINQ